MPQRLNLLGQWFNTPGDEPISLASRRGKVTIVHLVDRQGKIRFRWIGELNYGGREGEARMAKGVEELLQESP